MSSVGAFMGVNYPGIIDSLCAKIEASPQLSKKNKTLLLDYKNSLYAENLSPKTIYKFLRMARVIAEKWADNRDLDKLSKKDFEGIIANFNQGKFGIYTPQSKHSWLVALKRLYKWRKGTDDKEYPAEVSWIKTSMKVKDIKLPTNLPTPLEITNILKEAKTAKVKAAIAILFDSCARRDEFLSIKLKDIKIEGSWTYITIQKSKTKARELPLLECTPYLKAWIDEGKVDKEGFLWPSLQGHKEEHMSENSLRMLVSRAVEKAGYEPKRFNIHNFRKGGLTHKAEYMTESLLCEFAGWEQGSTMARRYVSVSQEQMKRRIAQQSGLKTEEQKNIAKIQVEVKCWHCKKINPPESSICNKCGAVLDPALAYKEQEKMKAQMQAMENKMQRYEEVTNFLLAKADKEELAKIKTKV